MEFGIKIQRYDGFLLYDDLGVDIWRCRLYALLGHGWMMDYSITMDTNAHLFLCSIASLRLL
jgi:hypothetical protein